MFEVNTPHTKYVIDGAYDYILYCGKKECSETNKVH